MSTQWRRQSRSHRELLIFVLLVLAFLIAASVTLTGCGEKQTETSAHLQQQPMQNYYGESLSGVWNANPQTRIHTEMDTSC